MGHKPWDRAWRRAGKARERKQMQAEARRTHYETHLAGMDDTELEREALVVMVTFETTNLAYNRDRLLAIYRECRDRDRTSIYNAAQERVRRQDLLGAYNALAASEKRERDAEAEAIRRKYGVRR